jgi:hypothetical protein
MRSFSSQGLKIVTPVGLTSFAFRVANVKLRRKPLIVADDGDFGTTVLPRDVAGAVSLPAQIQWNTFHRRCAKELHQGGGLRYGQIVQQGGSPLLRRLV